MRGMLACNKRLQQRFMLAPKWVLLSTLALLLDGEAMTRTSEFCDTGQASPLSWLSGATPQMLWHSLYSY
jgi:hypothetical protein